MQNRKLAVVIAALVAAAGAALAQSPPRPAVPGSTVTPADYLRWRDTFKNWGRWGADDQKRDVELDHAGESRERGEAGEDRASWFPSRTRCRSKATPKCRRASVFHRTTNGHQRDEYDRQLFGELSRAGVSHMDAFCHFFFDGKMFNGYSVAENITPETGCKKDSIMAWKDGVVTRAVLYDMPQLKGVD